MISMNFIGRKWVGVLFKLAFEKAYGEVKWPFLQQTLRMKGFAQGWCEMIVPFVQGGQVGIRVNDDILPLFPNHERFETRGSPLSNAF